MADALKYMLAYVKKVIFSSFNIVNYSSLYHHNSKFTKKIASIWLLSSPAHAPHLFFHFLP